MWQFKAYSLLSNEEHQELLAIRNEQQIREFSHNSQEILFKEHLKWVGSLGLSSHYFALFVEGKVVGGVNYRKKGAEVLEWGIFFTKKLQPLVATMATFIFIEHMFKEHTVLHSEVLEENTQALRFNEYFGIRTVAQRNGSFCLQLTRKEWQKHRDVLRAVSRRVAHVVYEFEE